jgi:colicin import membrane protein
VADKEWHGGPYRRTLNPGLCERAMAAALNGIALQPLTRAYEPGRSASGSSATSHDVSTSRSTGTRFDAPGGTGTRQNVGGAVADRDATQKSPIPCIRPRLVGRASQLRDGTTGGGPMGNTKRARRLSRLTTTGLSELPTNAAWLLSKALKPALSAATGASSVTEGVSGAASSAAGTAGAAGARVREKAKAARRSVADALPLIGHDSVATLMREADAAAEHAHDQETLALSVAQEAKDSADEAARVAHESDDFVQQVRRDTERRVAGAVEEARERFERDRRAEEAEGRKAIEKAEAQASARTGEADRKAEEAQARAREAIQEASQALIEARDLASQAATAAKEIAAQASQEADRLAKHAQAGAEVERRVIKPNQLRQTASGGAAGDSGGSDGNSVAAPMHGRGKPDALTRGELDALTKAELLRLTGDLDVEGRLSMSKSELIDSISRKGGVQLDALTKEELLRLGRTTGSDVRTSMTKDELITAISTRGGPGT